MFFGKNSMLLEIGLWSLFSGYIGGGTQIQEIYLQFSVD